MKKIVFAIGRFFPPTIGHMRLAEKIREVADEKEADTMVFLTSWKKAVKGKKVVEYSPSPSDLQKAFGGLAKVCPYTPKDFFEVCQRVYDQGYRDVTVVCGTDRAKKFSHVFRDYFKDVKAEIVEVPRTDEDISSTKMRQFVVEGDKKSFRKNLPVNLRDDNDTDFLFSQIARRIAP